MAVSHVGSDGRDATLFEDIFHSREFVPVPATRIDEACRALIFSPVSLDTKDRDATHSPSSSKGFNPPRYREELLRELETRSLHSFASHQARPLPTPISSTGYLGLDLLWDAVEELKGGPRRRSVADGSGAHSLAGTAHTTGSRTEHMALHFVVMIAQRKFHLQEYDTQHNAVALRLLSWTSQKEQRVAKVVEKHRQREEEIVERLMKRSQHRRPQTPSAGPGAEWNRDMRVPASCFADFSAHFTPPRVYVDKSEIEMKECSFKPAIRNASTGKERRRPQDFFTGGLEWQKKREKKLAAKIEKRDQEAKEQHDIDYTPWSMSPNSKRLVKRRMRRMSQGCREKSLGLESTEDPTDRAQHQPAECLHIESSGVVPGATSVSGLPLPPRGPPRTVTEEDSRATRSKRLTQYFPSFLERTEADISCRRQRAVERAFRATDARQAPAAESFDEVGSVVVKGNSPPIRLDYEPAVLQETSKPPKIPSPISSPSAPEAATAVHETPRNCESLNRSTSNGDLDELPAQPSLATAPVFFYEEPWSVIPSCHDWGVSDSQVARAMHAIEDQRGTDLERYSNPLSPEYLCYAPFAVAPHRTPSSPRSGLARGSSSPPPRPMGSERENQWPDGLERRRPLPRGASGGGSPLKRSPCSGASTHGLLHVPLASRRRLTSAEQHRFSERHELWARKREMKRHNVGQEQENRKMSDCTYRPQVNDAFNTRYTQKYSSDRVLPSGGSHRSVGPSADLGTSRATGLFDPMAVSLSVAFAGGRHKNRSPPPAAAPADGIEFVSAAKRRILKAQQSRRGSPTALSALILNYNDIRELKLKQPIEGRSSCATGVTKARQIGRPQKQRQRSPMEPFKSREQLTAGVHHGNVRGGACAASRPSTNSNSATIYSVPPDARDDGKAFSDLSKPPGHPLTAEHICAVPEFQGLNRSSVTAAGAGRSVQVDSAVDVAFAELEGLSDWWVAIVSSNIGTEAVARRGTLEGGNVLAPEGFVSPFECSVSARLVHHLLLQLEASHAPAVAPLSSAALGRQVEWISFRDFVTLYVSLKGPRSDAQRV